MTTVVHKIGDVRYTKIHLDEVSDLVKLMDDRVLEIREPMTLWNVEVLCEVPTGYGGKKIVWALRGIVDEDPVVTKKKAEQNTKLVKKLKKEREEKADRAAKDRRDGRWWRKLLRLLFRKAPTPPIPVAKVEKND